MGVIRLIALALFTSVTVAFAYAGGPRFIMGRPRDGFRPDPVYRRLGNQELNNGMNRAKLRNRCEYVSTAITMDQMMDHFNESDKRTWLQMYYYNRTFYKPGSPIFLMLGGEGPESGYWSNCQEVPFVDWAVQHNAAVYSLEHRFYGRSRPFPTQTVDNLKYLSSRQAIEDAAFFIRYINEEQHYNNPKWIVFGGSYSGALAAWMREKHPELVVGAVGSSGPVQPVLDFHQYLEVVQNALATESPSCANAVQTAFSEMSALIWTPSGRKTLSDTFKLSPRLEQTKLRYKDIQNFFSTMYGYFQGAVQYSGDNIGSHTLGGGIPQVCQIMNDASLTTLERVQKTAVYLTEYSGQENFTVTGIDYDAMIRDLKNVDYDKYGYESAARSWTWQTCTEFGYFQTTDLGRNIFGSVTPSNLFIDMCTDIFGSAFTVASISQSIHDTEKYYGGRDHFKATNVVLPNGDIDPWHALGLYSNIEPSVVPILIHGTAHCADMYPASPRDPPSLTNARKLIKANIDAWVSGRPGHRAAKLPTKVEQQTTFRTPKPFVSSVHSVPLRPFAEEMNAVESVPKHLNRFFRGRPLQGMLQAPPIPSTLVDYPQNFTAGNIRMPVDHFDATNTNTFNQRFWRNAQYAKPGGPHFLMIGGEGTANVKWVSNPNVHIMRAARQFSATVYMLEHRYYGESWPTPDQSTENLKWLTSEQALADLAQFINTMNSQYDIKNPHWVTFGGSYPGMLSAWFRQFYPELTVGALASSAPINAKVDFYEYLMVVQNSLTVFNPKCAERTKLGFEEMHKLVMTPEGRVTLSDLFKLEPAWTLTSKVTELDVENLFSSMYGNFQGAVQYNNDNSGDHATGGGIREVCERMLNTTRTPLEAVADVNVYIMVFSDGEFESTSNRYMDYIDYLRNVTEKTSARSWTYQTCNEFGFFQSTDIGANIFGSPTPVNYFIDSCQDAFGPEFTPRRVYDLVRKSSKFYGGSDYYRGSNVLFTNGNIDPWHALSKYDGTGSVKTILMNGTAHCAEMYPPRAEDAPDLAPTRALIEEEIAIWLKEARNPTNSGPAMATYPTAMYLLSLAYLMLTRA